MRQVSLTCQRTSGEARPRRPAQGLVGRVKRRRRCSTACAPGNTRKRLFTRRVDVEGHGLHRFTRPVNGERTDSFAAADELTNTLCNCTVSTCLLLCIVVGTTEPVLVPHGMPPSLSRLAAQGWHCLRLPVVPGSAFRTSVTKKEDGDEDEEKRGSFFA